MVAISDSLALKNDGTVVAWGYGDYAPHAGLTNIVAIAAGYSHKLALKADGTVVAWGWPEYLVNVPAGLRNVVAIAAGGEHSLALKADGTVVAWGAGLTIDHLSSYSNFGQSMVPLGLTNVVAIAAGGHHSLALKSDGTVVAWGDNSSGQTNVPAGLAPPLGGAVAIAADLWFGFSLALRADGTVAAWGRNDYGQTDVPAGWAPPLGGVVAIAAGYSHSLALVGQGPPFLGMRPSSRVSYSGQPFVLHASATGAWPMQYQWQRNGTDLADATNSSLILPNLLPTDAGLYSVVVRNTFGSVTNPYVQLTVVDSPPWIVAVPTNQITTPDQGATFRVCESEEGSNWSQYRIRLREGVGWQRDDGIPASAADLEQVLSALESIEFEVQLGEPVEGIGLDSVELLAPCGTEPPVLTIRRVGNAVVLEWPAEATCWQLEATENLTVPGWNTTNVVALDATVLDGLNRVTVAVTNTSGF